MLMSVSVGENNFLFFEVFLSSFICTKTTRGEIKDTGKNEVAPIAVYPLPQLIN